VDNLSKIELSKLMIKEGGMTRCVCARLLTKTTLGYEPVGFQQSSGPFVVLA
jgi:hypothetical protein